MRSALAPCLVLDGFELPEPLFAGGTAQVWSVARKGDPTPLILKVPRLRDSDDPVTSKSPEATKRGTWEHPDQLPPTDRAQRLEPAAGVGHRAAAARQV